MSQSEGKFNRLDSLDDIKKSIPMQEWTSPLKGDGERESQLKGDIQSRQKSIKNRKIVS